MSVDAIALLPSVTFPPAKTVEEGWHYGLSDTGANILWRPLQDGALVNLMVPFASADADLHAAARAALGKVPRRIWMFPDTHVPDVDTVRALRTATGDAGRWVESGRRKRSLLEDFGFTAKEAAAWQRDLSSGDPTRVAAARDALEQRLSGRDEAEVQALIRESLRR
jgi:hypothetical protein